MYRVFSFGDWSHGGVLGCMDWSFVIIVYVWLFDIFVYWTYSLLHRAVFRELVQYSVFNICNVPWTLHLSCLLSIP